MVETNEMPWRATRDQVIQNTDLAIRSLTATLSTSCACAWSVHALPRRCVAAAQEADEAHQEGHVNRKQVVGQEAVADALHPLAEEEPEGRPEVEGELTKQGDSIEYVIPHEPTAREHGDEQ